MGKDEALSPRPSPLLQRTATEGPDADYSQAGKVFFPLPSIAVFALTFHFVCF